MTERRKTLREQFPKEYDATMKRVRAEYEARRRMLPERESPTLQEIVRDAAWCAFGGPLPLGVLRNALRAMHGLPKT